MGESKDSTVRLSKYLLSPDPSYSSIWLGVLLSTLQYAAVSHSQRRFLLRNPQNEGVEVWLFARAKFTTSLGRVWTTLGRGEGWRGYRVFFRTPKEDGEGVETVELPEAVWRWTKAALGEIEGSLPVELRGLMGDEWGCGYLVSNV